MAFFAMVGFEDSVNMVEETKEPERIFPRTLFLGLGIAAVIYVLVALAVVTVLSPEAIAKAGETDEGVLLAAVREGMPGFPVSTIFPFLTVFAVANTALINMLMASRLIYGMARQEVLPRGLGKVMPTRRSPWASIVFTTLLALGLLIAVNFVAESSVDALAGTTGLLLLVVFAVVNVALLVVRRRRPDTEEGTFRAPGWTPYLAAAACLFLAGPWARTSEDLVQYRIAAALVGVGLALWAVTWWGTRGTRREHDWDRVD